MKIPTYDKLMIPTIRALKALDGSGHNSEIYDKVVELEEFDEEILAIPTVEKMTRQKLNTNLRGQKVI